MNPIETFVYNIVRGNPKIKLFVRNIYQGCFDLLPRKKELIPEGMEFRENYFFGFHDVSPLSADQSKLLAVHNHFDLRMPKPEEYLEVGYFDFHNGKLGDWHCVDKSFAWNYHKGCRLQWIDDESFIFNTAIDGRLCSKIDTLSGKSSIIDFPIDTVFISDTEKIATSFSYERLERCMPGYGYPYKDNGKLEVSAPEDTGLFLVDLTTNKRTLLLSLKRMATEVSGKIEEEFLHFVTHTEFSKSGRYISFLYRRIPKEGDYLKRRSVMCVYDRETDKLIILPSQESGSHYVWNNKDQIIASCFIDGKSCHALFDLNEVDNVRIIDGEHLNFDGHQSFITDDVFITDSYPDKYRMARIFKTDINSNESKLLANLYSPKKFQTKDFKCHIACDLHPRVIGEKWICCDSPRTGKRGLYIFPIK